VIVNSITQPVGGGRPPIVQHGNFRRQERTIQSIGHSKSRQCRHTNQSEFTSNCSLRSDLTRIIHEPGVFATTRAIVTRSVSEANSVTALAYASVTMGS